METADFASCCERIFATKSGLVSHLESVHAGQDVDTAENHPVNGALWSTCVSAAKSKFTVYPSAYANAWAVQEYKRRGGKWREKTSSDKASKDEGLGKWFNENWVDISRTNPDGSHPACGRPTDGMSAADYKSKYPKCVPASKAKSMSSGDKKSAVDRKRAANNAAGDKKGQKPKMVATDRAGMIEGDDDRSTDLISSIDACLDAAAMQIMDNDVTALPGWAQQVVSLCISAGVIVDDLMVLMKIEDPDDKAAKDPGMTKKDKDPKGGLTAAGRAKYNAAGHHLKKGVTGAADSPEKMRRKGSFLSRMFGPGAPGGMKGPDGKPSRRALSAAAWGEAVPTSDAGRARLYAKGQALLARYKSSKGDKADLHEDGLPCSCGRTFALDETFFNHYETVGCTDGSYVEPLN